MDLHLRGKRVLITGARRHGAAAAEAFAEEARRHAGGTQRRPVEGADRAAALGASDWRHRSRRRLAQPEGHSRLQKTQPTSTSSSQCRDIPGGSIDKIDERLASRLELKVFATFNLTRASTRR